MNAEQVEPILAAIRQIRGVAGADVGIPVDGNDWMARKVFESSIACDLAKIIWAIGDKVQWDEIRKALR
jgi:hypothetical protein